MAYLSRCIVARLFMLDEEDFIFKYSYCSSVPINKSSSLSRSWQSRRYFNRGKASLSMEYKNSLSKKKKTRFERHSPSQRSLSTETREEVRAPSFYSNTKSTQWNKSSFLSAIDQGYTYAIQTFSFVCRTWISSTMYHEIDRLRLLSLVSKYWYAYSIDDRHA